VAQLLLAASIITVLVLIAGSRFRDIDQDLERESWVEAYRPATELPCPWCGAETEESDTACPSCHRTFGVTV